MIKMVKIIEIHDEEFGREGIENLKPFYEMTKEESDIVSGEFHD